MKRFVIVATILIVLVLLAWFGTTFAISTLSEKGIRDHFTSNEGVPYSLSSYDRGLLSSDNVIEIQEEDGDGDAPLFLKTKLYHGPLALTPDGLKPGFSYSITTLDLEKISPELSVLIKDVFNGKDPVALKIATGFGKNRELKLNLAAADYEQDGLTVRFDGGDGKMDVSGDGDEFSGEIDLSPLLLKSGQDGNFSIRTGQSTIDFEVAKPGRMALEGTIGRGRIQALRSESEGGQFSLEYDDMKMSSDFKATNKAYPNVAFGKGKFVLPRIGVNAGPTVFALNDMEISQLAEQKDGKYHAQIEYEIGSVESTNEMLKSLDKKSINLKAGLTGISMEVAEKLAEFNRANQAANLRALRAGMSGQKGGSQAQMEMMAEKAPELGKTILEGIAKGTGVFLSLNLQENGQPSSLIDLSLLYHGASKLTDLTTVGQIIDAIAVKANIELEKEMVDSNPMLGVMLAGYIEAGMVQEKNGKFVFAADLAKSKLSIHGQETPFIQALGPKLEEKVEWDAMLEGISKGLEEKAQSGETQ